MNKSLIIIVAVVAIIAGVWYYSGRGTSGPASESVSPTATISTSPTAYPSVSIKPTPSVRVSVAPSPSKTPASSPTSTPVPTVSMSLSPTPTTSASPTPGLIFRESQTFTVNMQDLTFAPSPLTVVRGDVVVFNNNDTFTHAVSALNRMFENTNIPPGFQWSLDTANLDAGTYEYQDTLHTSMRGTLIIQ